MEREIFEAEIVYGVNDNKLKLNLIKYDLDNLDEIKENTKAILFLVNGEQFAIEVKNIDEIGISVSSIGDTNVLNYDLKHISELYVEVN